MPHRLSLSVACFLVAVATSGCPSDPAPSGCEMEKHRIEGTALTLLPEARLDRVGDGFVLIGLDGNQVRWAGLSKAGVIGDEQVVDVPPHVGTPWFAIAGVDAPGDRVVIAFVPEGAPSTGMVELMTFTVHFDNTMPTVPTVFGQIPATAQVAMASGRGGMHAALTWGVSGVRSVSARVVGGDGRAIGAELGLGAPDDFVCLRFSPGTGDMTVGYVDMSGTPPVPTFVATEVNADGTLRPQFRVPVGLQPTSCVEVTPNETGYGMAWHSSGIGTHFGMFTPGNPQFTSFEVLADVRVSGPVPTLGGLGWMGKYHAVLFNREKGGEVWPIDAMGRRQGVVPVFPSMGQPGMLSSQPADNALYATYADYAPSAAGAPRAGVRFLIKVSCPQGI